MGAFRIRHRTKRKIKKAIKKHGPWVALLIFTIVLIFKACEIETAYTLLGEAIPQTMALDSFVIENQGTIISEINGVKTETPYQKHLQVSGYKTDRVLSYAETEDVAFYNEAAYSYAVIDGEEMKFKKENIPSEYTEYTDVVKNVERMMIALPESVLSDVKIEKQDGLKSVSLKLTVNLFTQYYTEYAKAKKTYLIQTYELDDFSLSDVSVSISVNKKGYVETYCIAYKGLGKQATGDKMEEIIFSVEDRMTFIDAGTAVAVTPMVGYLNFHENVSAPYYLLESALAKIDALDAIDASYSLNMNIDMSLLEDTVDIPIHAVLQASGLQSGTPKIYSRRNISMLDVSRETEVYREGKYYYIYMAGQGIKIKESSVTNNYDVLADLQDLTLMLPEKILMNGQITENPDGTKIITVTVPSAEVAEIFDFHVDEAVMAISNEAEIISISPTNAKVLITVSADGYLLSYSCQFDMDMVLDMTKESDSQGMDMMEVKAIMDSIVTYAHPSIPVTVTPMEGYESFPYYE